MLRCKLLVRSGWSVINGCYKRRHDVMLADDVYADRYIEVEDRLDAPGRIVRPVFPRNLPGGLDRAALVAATQTFTVTRVLMIVVTFLAMAFHPDVWGADHPSSPTFWDAWYQWDARWYLRVA